jgi:hemerythrin-like domain-containing protein
MTSVIEALHKEHFDIARLLLALEHQIEIFAQAGSPDYDVIVGVADYFLDYPDRCHHPKEDAIFARLRQSHPDRAASIGDLAGEHRALHERAKQFRETIRLLNETDIPREVVVAAGREFIAAERRHMRGEEADFLPLADLLLTPSDWLEIEGELTAGSDPLFGGRVEATFRKLSDRLLGWEAENAAAAGVADGKLRP